MDRHSTGAWRRSARSEVPSLPQRRPSASWLSDQINDQRFFCSRNHFDTSRASLAPCSAVSCAFIKNSSIGCVGVPGFERTIRCTARFRRLPHFFRRSIASLVLCQRRSFLASLFRIAYLVGFRGSPFATRSRSRINSKLSFDRLFFATAIFGRFTMLRPEP